MRKSSSTIRALSALRPGLPLDLRDGFEGEAVFGATTTSDISARTGSAKTILVPCPPSAQMRPPCNKINLRVICRARPAYDPQIDLVAWRAHLGGRRTRHENCLCTAGPCRDVGCCRRTENGFALKTVAQIQRQARSQCTQSPDC